MLKRVSKKNVDFKQKGGIYLRRIFLKDNYNNVFRYQRIVIYSKLNLRIKR